MPKAALHTAQQDRLNAGEGPHQDRRKPWFDRFGNGLPETRRRICKFFPRNPQSEGTGRSRVCLPRGPQIRRPHGAGQGLGCFPGAGLFDFRDDRRHTDFRLCLATCRGNVIKSRPETVNPDRPLQSMLFRRAPVRATQASNSNHLD